MTEQQQRIPRQRVPFYQRRSLWAFFIIMMLVRGYYSCQQKIEATKHEYIQGKQGQIRPGDYSLLTPGTPQENADTLRHTKEHTVEKTDYEGFYYEDYPDDSDGVIVRISYGAGVVSSVEILKMNTLDSLRRVINGIPLPNQK